MGCWSEMGPAGVIDAVRHFGGRGRIVYVHFRDVQGEVPCFNECFIDEGNQDTFAVVQALHEVGFTGFMITDHVPAMVEDTTWGHRGRAYAIGYIRAPHRRRAPRRLSIRRTAVRCAPGTRRACGSARPRR